MRNSFIILAIAAILVLGATFILGMSVTPDDAAAHTRHTLMGILAGLFTCFVHIVAFMYFVVCEKIVRQSVLSGQLAAEHFDKAQRLKGRAIKASMLGIGLMLLTTLLGGAAIAQYDKRWHFASAIVTLAGTLAVLTRQFVLIDEGAGNFEQAFAGNGASHHG